MDSGIERVKGSKKLLEVTNIPFPNLFSSEGGGMGGGCKNDIPDHFSKITEKSLKDPYIKNFCKFKQ